MKKIIKYSEFINEMNDTPESYVDITLRQIKRKIDNMFDHKDDDIDDINYDENTEKSVKNIRQAKDDSRNKTNMNFKDLGVRLESSEISKYSKLNDSLTIKFSDDDATYNLLIVIELKEALPKDDNKDFSHDDIKKCYIKFKKYSIDTFEIIGQITKNISIKDISEEFLINLKIELDDKFGDNEEFSIES